MKSELIVTIKNREPENKKQVRQFFDVPDGKYKYTRERADKRSNQQNKYLHAVMLPIIRDALREAGWNHVKTLEDAKDFVKVKFLKYDLVNETTGEVIEMYRNTSGLSKLQFMELVQDVQIWLNDFFSIQLPMPGEQSSMFKDFKAT